MVDETEEAWPEDEGDQAEEEAWPEEDEAPAPASTRVKGEANANEPAYDAFAVETDYDATEGNIDVKKAEEDEAATAAALESSNVVPLVKEQAFGATKGQEDQEYAAYDPTSPAEDEDDNVAAVETAYHDNSEIPRTGLQGPPAHRHREEVNVPCPVLLVGSQLTKECMLKPGRWIEVGRHAKAHILMQNSAVSKRHCKLQWPKGGKSVELRVLDGITYVNDKRLNVGSALTLKHGDLLKINGKGTTFRLLVNMRPINSLLPDVRSTDNFAIACKEAEQSVRSPEEELRRKIRKVRAAADSAREQAMQQEERLIQIQTGRAMRSQKMESQLETTRNFEKEVDKLEGVLVKSRDDWLERLQTQSELQEAHVKPLNEMTANTQLKLESLQFMKARYDREVHPEQHMQVSSALEPGPAPASVEVPSKFAAKPDDADGEEEAFADAPAKGLKDEESSFPKPSVEVLKTAATGADDDIADLFGDFDSDAEEELAAKRQRVE